MKRRRRDSPASTMLELWRPPQGAGEPVGCLTTTYTFHPRLFDEQCLARFLEIDSEPNREDLPFLLERERRLEGVYAGVLVDHTQAGVEHSLRWNVLPVRIHAGRQHAKLSLLAWSRHVRVVVASANLTEPGYRSNYEVAAAVDLTPEAGDQDFLADSIAFLRNLSGLVPGAAENQPHVARARVFLNDVERQCRKWQPLRRSAVRRRLTCTMPDVALLAARSNLDEVFAACRSRGASPNEVRVASPFFDADDDTGRITAALCKLMARGVTREVSFAVPAVPDGKAVGVPRLAAPKALWLTPQRYQGEVHIEILPQLDDAENPRRWHAKMLALVSERYTSLMVGSSNFTSAGMGVGHFRNAEANLLTIVDLEANSREPGQLDSVWPETETVDDPEAAEWLGAQPETEEEEASATPPVPDGFVSAIYRAGDKRSIHLTLAPDRLPDTWELHACGSNARELLSDASWREQGGASKIEIAWAPLYPPARILVRWASDGARLEAFMPLNVEDSRALPPPSGMENMSADDMLEILAASDRGSPATPRSCSSGRYVGSLRGTAGARTEVQGRERFG